MASCCRGFVFRFALKNKINLPPWRHFFESLVRWLSYLVLFAYIACRRWYEKHVRKAAADGYLLSTGVAYLLVRFLLTDSSVCLGRCGSWLCFSDDTTTTPPFILLRPGSHTKIIGQQSLATLLNLSKMVDLQERMDVMLRQEVCFYKTEDYMAPHFQQQLSAVSVNTFFASSSGSHSSKSSSSASSINEIWREKICEWAYQVIDHFDYSREVVGVAMHYLDRYLATRTVNKKVFQLAAMTSLFLAIKLYEPGRISMASMIELSRGYFSVDQMVAMEGSILR